MDPWGYSMLLMGSLGQGLLNFLFSPNDLGSGTTPVYRLSASREAFGILHTCSGRNYQLEGS